MSLNIKAFQDGDRFVVVFEGITPDTKEMIKSFLGAAMEVPGEAKPVVTKEEPITLPPVDEPKEEPLQETSTEGPTKDTKKYPDHPVFEDGEYQGLTPWHLIDTPDDKKSLIGYRYLMKQYKSGSLNDHQELKKASMDAIVCYLDYRFSMITDAKEYAKKLNEKQCKLFFDDFADAAPSSKKKEFLVQHGYADWDTFLKDGKLEDKQDMILLFINIFQKTK